MEVPLPLSIRTRASLSASFMLSGFMLAASPALAHHAMGGATPRTLWEGFASGIAHPVIGPDHFMFVVLAAVIFSFARAPWPLITTLIASAIAGTVLRVLPMEIPFAEAVVALTLVAAGAIVLYRALSGADRDVTRLAGIVALAGIAHGFAWGESVVGTDAPVLGSYLVGLAIVQAAVLGGLSYGFRSLAARMPSARVPVLASLGALGIIAGVGFLVA